MSRFTRVAFAAAGIAAAAAAAAVILTGGRDDEEIRTALILLAGVSYIGSGLVAWSQRPRNRIGALMVVDGFAWLAVALLDANDSSLFTIGALFSALPYAILVQLLLAFPSGRLESSVARVITVIAYLDVTVLVFATLLFGEPRNCDGCAESAIVVTRSEDIAAGISIASQLIGVGLALAALGMFVYRWQTATPARRRVLAPAVWPGSVTAILVIVWLVGGLVSESIGRVAGWLVLVGIASIPLAFLAGLLRSRLARWGVGLLLVELQGIEGPAELRNALARALRDPSLTLAYWLPESSSYVDAQGHPVELPAEGATQLATLVERDGRRVAALIHDSSLREDSELVEAVGAAAGMALENQRLQAELRARVDELGKSEERLRALIDASPLSIVEVDKKGRVTFWNKAAERLYGWSTEEVIGQQVSFIPRQKRGEIDAIRERMLRGELVQGVETLRLRKDGSLIDVVLSAGPVYDAAGRVDRYMAVSADISERKRAQDELRRERDFTSALVDNAPVLVIVFDREGRLLRFNHECENLTGYSFREVEGRHFWDLFILPEEAERIRRRLGEVWAGDFPSTNENYWLTRDGERRLILWSNNGLLDDSGEVEYIVSAGLDITERKRAEEEVKASRARIVEAQDAERRRLERNLHDGAQQRLVSLSLALRLAESKVRSEADSAEQILRGASEELAQALGELRELARGIHPAILTDRGLPAALEALAGRAPTPVELEVDLDERLPPPIEAAAYYVVSEALANIAKYAEASIVTVSVARADGYALVEVADDGVGGADPARGSGLRGLTDRVEALDGRLEVESLLGHGTRIRAAIPLG